MENNTEFFQCRICLIRIDIIETIPLFEKNPLFENLTNADLIKECTTVHIKKKDGFSQYICTNCLEKLNVSYNFKKLCLTADIRFKLEYLNKLSKNVSSPTNNFTNQIVSYSENSDESDSEIRKKILQKKVKLEKLLSDNNCKNQISNDIDYIETDNGFICDIDSKENIGIQSENLEDIRENLFKEKDVEEIKSDEECYETTNVKTKRPRKQRHLNYYKKYNIEMYKKIFTEIANGMSFRTVSKKYNVSTTTLYDKWNGKHLKPNELKIIKAIKEKALAKKKVRIKYQYSDELCRNLFIDLTKGMSYVNASKKYNIPQRSILFDKWKTNKCGKWTEEIIALKKQLNRPDIPETYQRYSIEFYRQIFTDIANGMSFYTASRKYRVSKTTIYDKWNGKHLKPEQVNEIMEIKKEVLGKRKKPRKRGTTCHICLENFAKNGHLVRHLQKEHKENGYYKCPWCSKLYNNGHSIKEHLLVHPEYLQKIKYYTCEECGEKFVKKRLYNLHKSTHVINHVLCSMCGRHFKDQTVLKVHMRTHTGEKPYRCEECGKAFSTLATLKGHQLTHSSEKHFHCHLCTKSFRSRTSLNRHHIVEHTSEFRFSCTSCPKKFKIRADMTKHIRAIHQGFKFNCEFCCKSYNRRGGLRRHQLTHHQPLLNFINDFDIKTDADDSFE